MLKPFVYRPRPTYPAARHAEFVSEMAVLRERHIATKVDKLIEQAVDRILASRTANINAGDPDSVREMGVVITGESGAGKSRLAKRHVRDRADLQKESPDTQGLPFISVRFRPPLTQRSAGFQTRRALGYPIARFDYRDPQWDDVANRIAANGTKIIHYDEAQDIFIRANVNDQNNIRGSFKSLMTDSAPVGLVLTGIPILGVLLKKDPQLCTRLIEIELPRVSAARNLKEITAVADEFCRLVGIQNALVEDDFDRLFHYANYQRGLLFSRLIDGIEEALLAGAISLERLHLAYAHEILKTVPPALNFFVADNWRNLPSDADHLESEPAAPRRRSPNRKDTHY